MFKNILGVIVVILFAFFVLGCIDRNSATADQPSMGVYLGHINYKSVTKFVDGDNVCYVVSTTSSPVTISCVKK